MVLAQAKEMVKKEASPQEPEASLFSNLYSCLSDAISRILPRKRHREDGSSSDEADSEEKASPIFIERLMSWYARTLLKPKVRAFVIVFCLVLFGVCVYGTTQLRQQFSPRDYVPSDSYIQGFFRSRKYDKPASGTSCASNLTVCLLSTSFSVRVLGVGLDF